MQFHAIIGGKTYLIHDDEDSDMKYEKINPAEVAAQRRADIEAGKSLIPKNTCHYCGHGIGRGQLWCSAGCAKSFEDERKSVAGAPDGV